jgi:putative membrane protein
LTTTVSPASDDRRGGNRWRRLVPIAVAGLGAAVIIALVAWLGADAVWRSLRAVGWPGFAAICAIHLGLIAVMGLAWRLLVPGTRAWVMLWGRLLRDAGSEVLPLSALGGCALGVRVVTVGGVSGSVAAASTIVDLTLEFLAKLGYTFLGLLWLVHLRPGSTAAGPIALGLGLALVGAMTLVAAQRRGFALFDRFARLLGRGWADRTAAGAAAIHHALDRIYRLRGSLWGGFGLHLFCWIAGTLEVWLALRLAGQPLSFGVVMIIESLVYAARSAAFAIPNAVGVQEGAYVLIGAAFGLGPEMAVALSLLKRARDLAIGGPALMAWQMTESGRWWRDHPTVPAGRES